LRLERHVHEVAWPPENLGVILANDVAQSRPFAQDGVLEAQCLDVDFLN